MAETAPSAGEMPEAPPTAVDDVSILSNRPFLLLWAAQVLSQIAQNALLLGLLVLVQNQTKSPTHLSLVTFCMILPSVLFSMFAGVIVDHLNKKSVLVTTNVLRAAASLSYLLLDRSLGLIYIVSFLFSTVAQFFAPAEAAAIPMIVSKRQLLTANSLFNLTLSAAQLVGLVIVAPLLVKAVGTNGFFVVLAVLFALAAVCVAFLPRDKQTAGALTRADAGQMVGSIWSELVEGLRILRSDRLASLAMLYLTLIASLVPMVAVLGPVFAVSVIRANPEDVVYLFAPAGVAMVLTTVLIGGVVQRFGKLRVMFSGVAVLGVSLALLATAKTGGMYLLYNIVGLVVDTRHTVLGLVPIVMVLSFLMGIGFMCVSVPSQTLLQERCPPTFRGRIFGVQFTLSGAMSLIPLLGAGGLADIFGVNKTIFLLGVIVLAIGLVTFRVVGLKEPENPAT